MGCRTSSGTNGTSPTFPFSCHHHARQKVKTHDGISASTGFGRRLQAIWALYVGAALAESQSDHAEARKMLATCLRLRRALGNEVDIAATLSTLSMARLQSGDAAGAAVKIGRA